MIRRNTLFGTITALASAVALTGAARADDTAWQFKAGGRYDFSERWFVDAAATYLAASSVRMELPADSSQTIESDYDHLTLLLGVGWRF